MLENQLKQLGFSKNESEVYLALFELGKVRAGEIIDHTKLHRNIVYTALEELIKRELATKTTVKGVAEFVANDPTRLVDELEEKKFSAMKIVEELKKKQEEVPREISIHEGVDGIKRSRNKSLSLPEGEEVYILGASQLGTIPELEAYWKQYYKKRSKKGIKAKFLFDRTAKPEMLAWRSRLPATEAKYLPFDTELPIWFEFFGDQLGIGLPGDNPLLFNIKSKKAVEGFKSFFDYFWNQEARTTTGHEALHSTLYGMLDELQEGDEYFVLGATFGPYAEETIGFYEEYHKKRIQKGAIVNMLVSHESYDILYKLFADFGDADYTISHLRKLSSAFRQPFAIYLYKNKTRIVIHGKNPIIVHLDRAEVFTGFMSYFDTLWKQKVKSFEGNKGFYTAFGDITDTLNAGEELLVMGIFDFDPEFAEMVQNFHKGRAEKGINARILLNAHAKTIMGDPLSKLPRTDVRYMQKGIATPAVFLIYGEKTLVTIPGSRTFFRLENKDAADAFRVYFENLWG